MGTDWIIDYCKQLPLVQPDYPFDQRTLVFKILGKIFCIMDMEDSGWFALKCDPEMSLLLRADWTEIEPAWHMNKKYWIQLDLSGTLPDEMIQGLIRHSYSEVVKKMTLKVKTAHPILSSIQYRYEP